MYKEYKDRLETLVSIGYLDYISYLVSDLWLSIRKSVLERDRYKCWCCRKRAITVHHTSYSREVLLGNDNKKLIALCMSCHTRAEVSKTGRKFKLETANRRLKRFKSEFKRYSRFRHSRKKSHRKK